MRFFCVKLFDSDCHNSQSLYQPTNQNSLKESKQWVRDPAGLREWILIPFISRSVEVLRHNSLEFLSVAVPKKWFCSSQWLALGTKSEAGIVRGWALQSQHMASVQSLTLTWQFFKLGRKSRLERKKILKTS